VTRCIAPVIAAAIALGALPLATASPASAAPAAGPRPVQVGSGSYAEFPPASADAGKKAGETVTDLMSMPLDIDPSQAGKPVPTNKWFTNDIVRQWSGNLLSEPLVQSTTAKGVTISYPTTWAAGGSEMKLDASLTVGGTVVTTPGPTDVTVSDFESAASTTGWTRTGDAFATLPVTGTVPGQSTPVTGYVGKGYAGSYTTGKGDGAQGTLTSPAFTVDHRTIAFLIGGGDTKTANEQAQLLVGGKVVLTATGKDAEKLAWAGWDVSAYQGQQAQFRIVDASGGGWGHVMVDQVVASDDDVATVSHRYDDTFTPERSTALRWGDQDYTARLQQTGGSQHMDVTAYRGSPYTWIETEGVTPRITVAADAVITDSAGKALTFPLTTDRFAVTQGGRTFGVHAPANTTFTRSGTVLTVTTPITHLVVSAVPKTGLTLDDLQRTAFAVPRDSRMDYALDQQAGTVSETWTVDTEPLEGTGTDTVVGFLPQFYVDTTTDVGFTPATYDTPQGPLRTAVGSGGFTVTFPFEGLAPMAATPTADGFDLARMTGYVDDYVPHAADKLRNSGGNDTYWTGKELQQAAEYMLIAQQIGDTGAFTALQGLLRTALTDWYTYTPGETAGYFTDYGTWGGLTGFADSYGSDRFNDRHFHHGYFALAAGMLASTDPQFAAQYGEMATQVTRDYANWERGDERFPYFRTFDTFLGRSNAGGFSSEGGENQESSSEAIQSWFGEYLLGTALGNADMQAAGAMGYVTERATVRQTYMDAVGGADASDPHGPSVWPKEFTGPWVGILNDKGPTYGNYFTGDCLWSAGIQWMPTGQELNYLGWDPAFAHKRLTKIFDRREVCQAQMAPGGVSEVLELAAKNRFGVGTYYGGVVTRSDAGMVTALTDAVKRAYLANPGRVTDPSTDNPLVDEATGKLMVTVTSTGLQFPAEYWTAETLPAQFLPPQPPTAEPDAAGKEYMASWPLYDRLVATFTADPAAMEQVYSYDAANYQAGRDAPHAADVIDRMGEALGNVYLGFLAQADPAQYADIADELWRRKSPVATAASMNGLDYWQAMANLGRGTETLDRHTSSPLSQVYRAADGTYTYTVHNPTDTEQSYPAYQGTGAAAKVIGTIRVPARTTLDHQLDAHLDHIAVTAAGTVRTVQRGTTLQLTATGTDQYGATSDLTATRWTVDGGGTVSPTGLFTATTDADPVTVTATSGGQQATYTLRVAPTPVLTALTVTPGSRQLESGGTQQYGVTGADQYGDPADPGTVTWSTTAPGTFAGSTLTGGTSGAGYVTATSATGVTGTAVVSVVAPLSNVATGKKATASTSTGGNTPDKALDGLKDQAHRWESKQGVDDQWWQVDLGASYDVSRIHIDWENAAARTYEVVLSDDPNGATAPLRSVTKADAGPDDLAVSGSGRYLRVHGLTRRTQYGYSILEVGVYGTPSVTAGAATQVLVSPQSSSVLPGRTVQLAAYAFDAAGNGGPLPAAGPATWTTTAGSVTATGTVTAPASGRATVTATVGAASGTATVDAFQQATVPDPTPTPAPTPALVNVALGKPATASSVEWKGTPVAAVDDDRVSTRWSSAWGHDDEWVEVDLGKVTDIARISTNWEDAYATTFRIEVRDSADGAWRQVGDVRTGSKGETAYDVSTSGRFVRVHGLTRADARYGYSLYELGVFAARG
jgi:hypothetical protein